MSTLIDPLFKHTVLMYAITFMCLAIVTQQFLLGLKAPAASAPGPWYTRWTYLPSKFYWLMGQRTYWIHSLHERYGSVVRYSPTDVSISDLASATAIHKIPSQFTKTEFYGRMTGNRIVNGQEVHSTFTTRDIAAHGHRRRLLAQPLSESALRKHEPTASANIYRTINGIEREMKDKGSVNIFDMFMMMATDIIGELTFSESFKMTEQCKANQYLKDLQNIAQNSGIRAEFSGLVKILSALHVKPFSDVQPSLERLFSYSVQSFDRYKQQLALNPTDPKPTLFTKLIAKENEPVEGKLSSEILKREGVSYITAGSDTTAITMTYLVYAVTRAPEVRARLLAELAGLPEGFGWGHLRSLSYLNYVIEEALRLYAAVPSALPRNVPKGGAYLAGFYFSDKVVVSTQAYTLHRNPTVFPNPERFEPERWANPTPEMKASFTPFGAGARICLGMHLARNELRMATALFFKKFPKARVVSNETEMKQKIYFLAVPSESKCMVVAS